MPGMPPDWRSSALGRRVSTVAVISRMAPLGSASTRGTTYGAVSIERGSLIGNLGQSGSVGNLKDKDYRITFRTGMLFGVEV